MLLAATAAVMIQGHLGLDPVEAVRLVGHCRFLSSCTVIPEQNGPHGLVKSDV
jgi:hypothetical protein